MKDWKKYTKLLLTAAAASVVMLAAPATATAMAAPEQIICRRFSPKKISSW